MRFITFQQKEALPLLTYEVWKVLFRKDCENRGLLFAFDPLGDFALKLLWEKGFAPTVRAIAEGVEGQA